jgi:hypothetical protein
MHWHRFLRKAFHNRFFFLDVSSLSKSQEKRKKKHALYYHIQAENAFLACLRSVHRAREADPHVKLPQAIDVHPEW